MVDKGWQWARDEVCRFAETMCKAATEKGPRYALSDYRETMHGLLEHLTRDPVKSYLVDQAERQNPRTYDFLTSAINSPRGKGVVLVAYARWVAEHVQREEGGRKIVPNGFGDMPEVKTMLEWQIAAENGSYEASAVIGSYIGLLHWVDPSWVKENASKIFDLAAIEREPTRAFGWAAWNSFSCLGPSSRRFLSDASLAVRLCGGASFGRYVAAQRGRDAIASPGRTSHCFVWVGTSPDRRR